MANKIVETIYRLKDQVSAGLSKIGDAWRGAREDADKTSRVVEASNTRMGSGFSALTAGVRKFGAAIAAVAVVVGFRAIKDGIVEVLETGEQFDDLGKKFSAAFGGLAEGTRSLEKVRVLAKDVPFSFDEIANAAVKLKRAGFDPLDGSLQALIDNTVATDGSAQDLIGTIETLGKAAIKGEIGTRALVSLTEKGIPVFDLLGKALGKSSDEVRKLAETGELGADSIQLLVTELGKLRAGAASDEVKDLDSQLIKLRDTLNEVKNSIAQGGSLELAREQFASINEAVSALAASPEFEKLKVTFNQTFASGIEAAKALVDNIDFAELIVEIDQLTGALRDTFRLIESADVIVGPFLNAFEKLTLPFKQMKFVAGQALKEITDGVEKLTGTGEKAEVAIAGIITPFSAIRNEVELVTNVVAKLRAELTQTAIEAKRTELISEAFKTIGVDAQNAGIEITEAGQKIITALELLATEADVTATGFRAAFNKALDSSQTVAEVKKMEAALKAAFGAGKVTAAEYAAGALKAAEKTAEITKAADLASGAIKGIGDSAEAEARRVIAAMEATRSSLAGTAELISRQLSAALKDGASTDQIKALKDELALTEAQIRGVTKEIETTRASLKGAAEEGTQAFDQIAQGAEKAAAANEETAAAAEGTGAAIGGILGQLVAVFQKFSAISPVAAEFFKESYNASVRLSHSLGDVAESIARAELATDRAVASQLAAAVQMQRSFEEVAESGEGAGFAFSQAARQGESALLDFANQAREGLGQLDLLNQADLDALADSAERAAAKIRQIEESANQARAALAALAEAEQDEIDQRSGNEEAIEQRRFEQRQRQIEELRRQGGDASRAEADDALRLAERNHFERLRQIEAERIARAASGKSSDAGGSQPQGSAGASAPRPANASPVSSGGLSLTINVQGPVIGGTPDQIAEQLARMIKPKLETMARRSA